MIKLTILVARKPTLTFAEFDEYWRTKHRKVIEDTREFNRHVKKYVQCHAISSDTIFGSDSTYDGIAELWFQDSQTMNTAFNEPKYLQIIRPDELAFVDVENCLSFVSEELPVL